METVLGLSMTPGSVGWVVIDGSSVDADILDHDVFDFPCGSADDGDISGHIAAVRGVQAIAAAGGQDVTSIGVTWTDDAAALAALMLRALPGLGFDKVVSMRLAQCETSHEAQLTRARSAALAVNSNAETIPLPVPQPRAVVTTGTSPWFGPPARAAAVLIAGVTALFVVAPEVAGQPDSRPTDVQQASDASATSRSVQAVVAPVATPPVANTIQLVVGRPEPAPPQRRAAPVTTAPVAVPAAPVRQVPVVTLSTDSALPADPEEAAPQPALFGPLPGPAPAPTMVPAAVPAAPPAQAVFNPLFSALP